MALPSLSIKLRDLAGNKGRGAISRTGLGVSRRVGGDFKDGRMKRLRTEYEALHFRVMVVEAIKATLPEYALCLACSFRLVTRRSTLLVDRMSLRAECRVGHCALCAFCSTGHIAQPWLGFASCIALSPPPPPSVSRFSSPFPCPGTCPAMPPGDGAQREHVRPVHAPRRFKPCLYRQRLSLCCRYGVREARMRGPCRPSRLSLSSYP